MYDTDSLLEIYENNGYMTSKQILTVGFELASDKVEKVDLRTKRSLVDADIVLFRPDIEDRFHVESLYQGKPSLDEHQSVRYRETCNHWNRQLKLAVEAGKTIIAFASPLREVYIDTGNREYSGTGRNEKTTVIVEKHNNYKTLPVSLEPVETYGKEMRLVPVGQNLLQTYWTEFGHHSGYKVILEGSDVPSCIETRDGTETVGAIYHNRSSAGALLVLPDLDFEADSFFVDEEEELMYTSCAREFASHLVRTVIEIDRQLKGQREKTPTPNWALKRAFELEPEQRIKKEISNASKDEETARSRREELEERLRATGSFRDLLYEKGDALESAIVSALKLMDFDASSFRDSDSQFDVVFESEEGRLIGEAEGKDNKAIGIDKLRQLNMNVQEDLARDEVTHPAKAVLFGNPYRLQDPEDRGEPFTDKCMKSAQVSSTALVYTPDLFHVVQSLLHCDDSNYIREVRQAILDTSGRVNFPQAPNLPHC